MKTHEWNKYWRERILKENEVCYKYLLMSFRPFLNILQEAAKLKRKREIKTPVDAEVSQEIHDQVHPYPKLVECHLPSFGSLLSFRVKSSVLKFRSACEIYQSIVRMLTVTEGINEARNQWF